MHSILSLQGNEGNFLNGRYDLSFSLQKELSIGSSIIISQKWEDGHGFSNDIDESTFIHRSEGRLG